MSPLEYREARKDSPTHVRLEWLDQRLGAATYVLKIGVHLTHQEYLELNDRGKLWFYMWNTGIPDFLKDYERGAALPPELSWVIAAGASGFAEVSDHLKHPLPDLPHYLLERGFPTIEERATAEYPRWLTIKNVDVRDASAA